MIRNLRKMPVLGNFRLRSQLWAVAHRFSLSGNVKRTQFDLEWVCLTLFSFNEPIRRNVIDKDVICHLNGLREELVSLLVLEFVIRVFFELCESGKFCCAFLFILTELTSATRYITYWKFYLTRKWSCCFNRLKETIIFLGCWHFS